MPQKWKTTREKILPALLMCCLLSTKRTDNEQKKRTIACTTDEKGRYCFRKMRAGKYEVLYSFDGGWKHTSVSVVVAPKNRKSVNQKLEIWLQVGTQQPREIAVHN